MFYNHVFDDSIWNRIILIFWHLRLKNENNRKSTKNRTSFQKVPSFQRDFFILFLTTLLELWLNYLKDNSSTPSSSTWTNQSPSPTQIKTLWTFAFSVYRIVDFKELKTYSDQFNVNINNEEHERKLNVCPDLLETFKSVRLISSLLSAIHSCTPCSPRRPILIVVWNEIPGWCIEYKNDEHFQQFISLLKTRGYFKSDDIYDEINKVSAQ